jgi:hypothetical protein
MDYFSGVTEAIKKASVAFTEALLTVSSVLQNIAGQAHTLIGTLKTPVNFPIPGGGPLKILRASAGTAPAG